MHVGAGFAKAPIAAGRREEGHPLQFVQGIEYLFFGHAGWVFLGVPARDSPKNPHKKEVENGNQIESLPSVGKASVACQVSKSQPQTRPVRGSELVEGISILSAGCRRAAARTAAGTGQIPDIPASKPSWKLALVCR